MRFTHESEGTLLVESGQHRAIIKLLDDDSVRMFGDDSMLIIASMMRTHISDMPAFLDIMLSTDIGCVVETSA